MISLSDGWESYDSLISYFQLIAAAFNICTNSSNVPAYQEEKYNVILTILCIF